MSKIFFTTNNLPYFCTASPISLQVSDQVGKLTSQSYIIANKLICYGGTALNNILPKENQFYDYDYYSPDYDFFSPKAIDHVKELAIIFKKKKYHRHHGILLNTIPTIFLQHLYRT